MNSVFMMSHAVDKLQYWTLIKYELTSSNF